MPVLGICFGAQVLAAALGGTVEPAGQAEIGWVMVDSADPELIPPGPWLEFHHDRCLPPARPRCSPATSWASRRTGSAGPRRAVPPEVDGDQFRLWLAAGGRAEIAANGQDPDAMLAETIAEGPAPPPGPTGLSIPRCEPPPKPESFVVVGTTTTKERVS